MAARKFLAPVLSMSGLPNGPAAISVLVKAHFSAGQPHGRECRRYTDPPISDASGAQVVFRRAAEVPHI
jgi:hypothetical protein